MSVTLKDIADQAGVSEATVSLVLRGQGRVADATRKRIEHLALELNYRPRARRSNGPRAFEVALLVWERYIESSEMEHGVLAKQDGMVDYFSARNVTVVVHRLPAVAGPDAGLEFVKSRRFDGFVLQTPVPGAILDFLIDARIPTIHQHTADPDVVNHHTVIASNNYDGAFQVVNHLHGLGHERIGLISLSLSRRFALERKRGYQAALLEAGLEVRPEWCVVCDTLHEAVDSGLVAMHRLLDLAEPPTAVFAVSDLLAVGALRACGARGVDVPAQMSIVGYNHSLVARTCVPTLTTVDLRGRDAGRLGAGELYRAMCEPDYLPRRVSLPGELIVGGSTAAPGGHRAATASARLATEED